MNKELVKRLKSLREQIAVEGPIMHVEEGDTTLDAYELMTSKLEPMSIMDLYDGSEEEAA